MDEPGIRTHRNLYGEFREAAAAVYISNDIRSSQLAVPAAISATNTASHIEFDANTVVVSVDQADKWLADKFSSHPEFEAAQTQLGEWLQPDRNMEGGEFSVAGTGSAAMTSNAAHGGLIKLETGNDRQFREFSGIGDIAELKVPKVYIDNFRAAIAVHERGHLRDDHADEHGALGGEITADISLRQEFNAPFNQFYQDMRALRSLNMVADNDDHATHIWSEEMASGRMPTEAEETQIGAAPAKIQDRAISVIANGIIARDGVSAEQAEATAVQMMSATGPRVEAYRQLQEKQAFRDIPYAGEFVDKYLAAAGRSYTNETLSGADPKWIGDRINAGIGAQNISTSTPQVAMAAPAGP